MTLHNFALLSLYFKWLGKVSSNNQSAFAIIFPYILLIVCLYHSTSKYFGKRLDKYECNYVIIQEVSMNSCQLKCWKQTFYKHANLTRCVQLKICLILDIKTLLLCNLTFWSDNIIFDLFLQNFHLLAQHSNKTYINTDIKI